MLCDKYVKFVATMKASTWCLPVMPLEASLSLTNMMAAFPYNTAILESQP